jgi:uncharacterized protein YndB with AHSA1/START domain
MSSKPQKKPQGRTVETEMAIDAPLEAVWKALTEAGELTRWFPVEARSSPHDSQYSPSARPFAVGSHEGHEGGTKGVRAGPWRGTPVRWG